MIIKCTQTKLIRTDREKKQRTSVYKEKLNKLKLSFSYLAFVVSSADCPLDLSCRQSMSPPPPPDDDAWGI